MLSKKVQGFFPLSFLVKLLLGLALGIQIIVISYNHYSGYYILGGFEHFLLRLLRGVFLGFLAGFLIALPDLAIIDYLNKKVSWSTNIFKRILLQLPAAVFTAVVVSTFITLFAHAISPYTENFQGVLVNNALIYSVVNLLLMAILEAWIYFMESRKASREAKSLQEELLQIRFEVLKSQINPHFLFNSLNVLSGLISKDVEKAQLFIDEFSQIYRYVLESVEQPVTSLAKELEFMRSYLLLQQIRYGEDLKFEVDIPAQLLNLALPPLSLQVILENAIKHNIINEDKPLCIKIFSKDDWLIVKNDLQPKISMGASTGLGLKNLQKRYSLISSKKPVFSIETNHYIAKLPLIDIEPDESNNN